MAVTNNSTNNNKNHNSNNNNNNNNDRYGATGGEPLWVHAEVLVPLPQKGAVVVRVRDQAYDAVMKQNAASSKNRLNTVNGGTPRSSSRPGTSDGDRGQPTTYAHTRMHSRGPIAMITICVFDRRRPFGFCCSFLCKASRQQP